VVWPSTPWSALRESTKACLDRKSAVILCLEVLSKAPMFRLRWLSVGNDLYLAGATLATAEPYTSYRNMLANNEHSDWFALARDKAVASSDRCQV